MQQEFHLKLSCKKINSGKCQIRFQVKLNAKKNFYGYFLTDPNEKLKDVMTQLNSRLSMLKVSRDPLHSHLYSLGTNKNSLKNFVIFKSKAS